KQQAGLTTSLAFRGHGPERGIEERVAAEAAPTEVWWVALKLHLPYGSGRVFSQIHTAMVTPPWPLSLVSISRGKGDVTILSPRAPPPPFQSIVKFSSLYLKTGERDNDSKWLLEFRSQQQEDSVEEEENLITKKLDVLIFVFHRITQGTPDDSSSTSLQFPS
ncbi:MAG: hypothetical protein ACLQDF_00330, partial [Desulfomonilia bacterium]